MAKIFPIVIFFSLFAFSPAVAEAAALSISPATGSFETGERVSVKVIASSNTVPFNAVSGIVSFPTSLFSIESVSKTNSILNFWAAEPTISAGTVGFEGIALGGFAGPTGTVITVNLRAIKAGSGKISFQAGRILANDGIGTDITDTLAGATFSVKGATAQPAISEPEQELVPDILPPKPVLKAPKIILGTQYGVPTILGISEYENAPVLITFVAQSGEKIFFTSVAGADGGFEFLIPNSLKRGLYTITALMIKDDKTNSEPSNAIGVKIGGIFSDVGWEIFLLIGFLILTIIYLILRAYLHFRKKGGKGEYEENKSPKVAFSQ